MTELGSMETTWLEYISKLQKRRKLNQQISGITIYGLIAIIFYLFIDMIKNPNKIEQIYLNYKLTITIITNILNVFLLLLLIFALLMIILIFPFTRRLKSKLGEKEQKVVEILVHINFVLMSILNFFTAFYIRKFGYSPIPYLLIGIFILLQSILYIRFRIKLKKVFKKENLQKYEIPAFQFTSKKAFFFQKFVLFFLLLLYIIILISAVYNVGIISNIIKHNNLVVFSLKIFIIFIIFELVLLKVSEANREDWLSNLELEIMLGYLNNEEIKNRFLHDYIGNTTISHLKEIDISITNKAKLVIDQMDLIKNEISKYVSDEKKVGNVQKIFDPLLKDFHNLVDEYTNSIGEANKVLDAFMIQGSLIREEKDFYLIMMKHWKFQVESYNNKKSELINFLEMQGTKS